MNSTDHFKSIRVRVPKILFQRIRLGVPKILSKDQSRSSNRSSNDHFQRLRNGEQKYHLKWSNDQHNRLKNIVKMVIARSSTSSQNWLLYCKFKIKIIHIKKHNILQLKPLLGQLSVLQNTKTHHSISVMSCFKDQYLGQLDKWSVSQI